MAATVREAIKKKRLSFGHCPKGGGGSTGIQKFWGSFAFPYFDHLWDIKWGEMGGLTMLQKFGGTCLHKYWEFCATSSLKLPRRKEKKHVVQNSRTTNDVMCCTGPLQGTVVYCTLQVPARRPAFPEIHQRLRQWEGLGGR